MRNETIIQELTKAGILKKPTLYVMTGIPGSGKTTTAAKYGKVISSDDIREEYGITDYSPSSNKTVFDILERRVEKSLKKGNPTVYDSTNLFADKRERIVSKFQEFAGEIVSVFVNTPINEAKRRNKIRDRYVPEEIIDSMALSLEKPSLKDGFDRIIEI